jgi:hypothetical protein
MKILLPSILCALLFGTSASFRAQDGSSDSRVLEAQIAELEAQGNELRAALEEVQKYLLAQSASATRVLTSLQASEEAGFTKGINYEARESLLDAWRDYHGTLEQNVPGAKKEQANANRDS